MEKYVDQILLIAIITASVLGLLVIAFRKIKKTGQCCGGDGDKCSPDCSDCPLTDKCKKKH